MRRVPGHVLAIAVALLAACGSGSGGGSASSTASGPVTTPAATATASTATDGPRAFPNRSEVALEPGLYRSSPPFDIPFTFRLPETGWETGHLHGEFFDVLRDFGPDRVPGEWLAFAHPVYVDQAPGTDATGLTPGAALAILAARADLRITEPEPFELDGLSGARVDIHADGQNTHIFGGEAGEFGMGPDLDLRLGAVPFGSDLLLVLVLAPRTHLDDAWQHVQPILDSVDL